jgi:cell fate (sporulation/competence/biofilm development) regulator YlbF (YheA/YmcA/DUF963 family)
MASKKKAIQEMFDKIECEGGHEYAFCTYGMSDYLDKINDKTLNELVENYKEASNNLNSYLEELETKYKIER